MVLLMCLLVSGCLLCSKLMLGNFVCNDFCLSVFYVSHLVCHILVDNKFRLRNTQMGRCSLLRDEWREVYLMLVGMGITVFLLFSFRGYKRSKIHLYYFSIVKSNLYRALLQIISFECSGQVFLLPSLV